MTDVLVLDAAGTPTQWLSPRSAAYYVATGKVLWSIGEPFKVLRGGTCARTGVQSTLELPPIMAVRGDAYASRSYRSLSCTREGVFIRDRWLCAYCGRKFHESELTLDHVQPESRGGAWSWTNLVAACGGPQGCNTVKANRTPEEAGMPLLYVPYQPSRWEAFILENRKVRADQLEFLLSGVPAHSRLRN